MLSSLNNQFIIPFGLNLFDAKGEFKYFRSEMLTLLFITYTLLKKITADKKWNDYNFLHSPNPYHIITTEKNSILQNLSKPKKKYLMILFKVD